MEEEFVKLTIEQYRELSTVGLGFVLSDFVQKYPNDMELGAAIRKYFYELDNKIKSK